MVTMGWNKIQLSEYGLGWIRMGYDGLKLVQVGLAGNGSDEVAMGWNKIQLNEYGLGRVQTGSIRVGLVRMGWNG